MKKHKFNIFPEMSKEDYNLLLSDLKTNGYDHSQPIYIYQDAILDGWNRQKACIEIGINPIKKEFIGTDTEAIDFVMRTNKRRNLNSSQWAAIAAMAEGLIEQLKNEAKEKQRVNALNNQPQNPEIIPDSEKPVERTKQEKTQAETRSKVAKVYNTNPRYIGDAIHIKNEAPELLNKVIEGKINLPDAKILSKETPEKQTEILNRVESGQDKNVVSAKRSILKEETIKKLESIQEKESKVIQGVFDVIVIDPPWPIKKIERDCRPNQVILDYPTMSIDEIKNMDIPKAENCHLWLWVTHKFLPESFEILKAWSFKYVCCFTWHKPGGFQPVGLPQFNCEFALYARYGTPIFTETKSLPTCFNADRGKHSEKPQAFYDTIKRVTAGRRLDMFNRRQIDGFETWGKESA